MSISVEQEEAGLLEGTGYLLVRRLQSLTGIMFGGYLIVHLIVNATIAQGGSVYQAQVDKIHGLPFLEAIEWSAIFIPFLFHAAYGTWIGLTGRPNVASYPYYRNVYYLLQRLSAIVIVLFVLFHVLSLKFHVFGDTLAFVPKDQALASIGRHMNSSGWLPWVIYPLGVLASAYHTANGFWTGAITWGLTISASAQRRFGYICAVLCVVMALLGIIAIIATTQLEAVIAACGPDGPLA